VVPTHKAFAFQVSDDDKRSPATNIPAGIINKPPLTFIYLVIWDRRDSHQEYIACDLLLRYPSSLLHLSIFYSVHSLHEKVIDSTKKTLEIFPAKRRRKLQACSAVDKPQLPRQREHLLVLELPQDFI
jgi:hypothetical protein